MSGVAIVLGLWQVRSAILPESQSLRASARALKCSHSHLSRVLRGLRVSNSLMARYQQLKGTR